MTINPNQQNNNQQNQAPQNQEREERGDNNIVVHIAAGVVFNIPIHFIRGQIINESDNNINIIHNGENHILPAHSELFTRENGDIVINFLGNADNIGDIE